MANLSFRRPFANNELTEFPEALSRCTKLSEILLAGNIIPEIPASAGKLRRLEVLVLRKNRLQKLPPELSRAKRLHTLDLGDNPLSESPASAHNNNTKAFLGFLTALNQGLKTAMLKSLNLSFNALEAVPRQIAQLDILTIFDLREITRLIAQLDILTNLDLRDNLLSDLPIDI
ncbi:hypothetical protein T484DRAFT_1815566, partial [Baffinella frigidus]